MQFRRRYVIVRRNVRDKSVCDIQRSRKGKSLGDDGDARLHDAIQDVRPLGKRGYQYHRLREVHCGVRKVIACFRYFLIYKRLHGKLKFVLPLRLCFSPLLFLFLVFFHAQVENTKVAQATLLPEHRGSREQATIESTGLRKRHVRQSLRRMRRA